MLAIHYFYNFDYQINVCGEFIKKRYVLDIQLNLTVILRPFVILFVYTYIKILNILKIFKF